MLRMATHSRCHSVIHSVILLADEQCAPVAQHRMNMATQASSELSHQVDAAAVRSK